MAGIDPHIQAAIRAVQGHGQNLNNTHFENVKDIHKALSGVARRNPKAFRDQDAIKLHQATMMALAGGEAGIIKILKMNGYNDTKATAIARNFVDGDAGGATRIITQYVDDKNLVKAMQRTLGLKERQQDDRLGPITLGVAKNYNKKEETPSPTAAATSTAQQPSAEAPPADTPPAEKPAATVGTHAVQEPNNNWLSKGVANVRQWAENRINEINNGIKQLSQLKANGNSDNHPLGMSRLGAPTTSPNNDHGQQAARNFDSVPITSPARVRPIIYLDPGHGGHDSGAMVNGVKESEAVLAVAQKAARELRKAGYDVRLTRDKEFVSLNERKDMATKAGAALFISIHADHADSGHARGATIYRSRGPQNLGDIYSASRGLSGLLSEHMLKSLKQNEIIVRQSPIKEAGFTVISSNPTPAILMELGYLSNKEDAKNLKNDTWRDQAAQAITAGVEKYFKDPQAASLEERRQLLRQQKILTAATQKARKEFGRNNNESIKKHVADIAKKHGIVLDTNGNIDRESVKAAALGFNVESSPVPSVAGQGGASDKRADLGQKYIVLHSTARASIPPAPAPVASQDKPKKEPGEIIAVAQAMVMPKPASYPAPSAAA